ncbi:MAG: ATP-binding cassette domain-containing protein [Myxococcales bacterium]|nr:ATP-binding cassette domain-containing protein [Myxococcales bacterium]
MSVRHNPFSAARFAPGALPWLGAAGELDALADAAFQRGARHQILGPHGSGKSTLLAHLARVARRRGLEGRVVRGGRAEAGAVLRSLRADVVLLDEGEALGVGLRPFLALAAFAGTPLIVSVHRDVGLPTLLRCEASLDVAASIVTRLLGQAPDAGIVAARLDRHRGNLREVLFDFYDDVERAARMHRPG